MCHKIHCTNNVHFLLGEIFHRYKNMNSSFLAISTLMKSDIGEKNFNKIYMSAQPLRYYLECANTYKGNSSKKKTSY